MKLKANPKLYGKARYQRYHQTKTSEALWEALRYRKLGPRFHHEKPMGEYIVDFWCPAFLLVVEIHSVNFPYPPERREGLIKLGVREVLELPNVMPIPEMVEQIRDAMMRTKRPFFPVCSKHPGSGLTTIGTCFACYAEKYA